MKNALLNNTFKSCRFWLSEAADSLLHLAFPHICVGCGSDLLQKDQLLCLHCLDSLPLTSFAAHGNNPVEKLFWGRMSLTYGTAQYYFTKESLMQRLMHQVKYRANKELGLYLGRMMGNQLKNSNRFLHVDALVPLPLFPIKERKRGYNQAAVLCEGIAEVLQKPILHKVVIRTVHTESQTKMNRIQRWENMKDHFRLVDEDAIKGKHVLLVDDVITTGATLEACGTEILKATNTQLSIATLCFSS